MTTNELFVPDFLKKENNVVVDLATYDVQYISPGKLSYDEWIEYMTFERMPGWHTYS